MIMFPIYVNGEMMQYTMRLPSLFHLYVDLELDHTKDDQDYTEKNISTIRRGAF